jgi:hypothetical protein
MVVAFLLLFFIDKVAECPPDSHLPRILCGLLEILLFLE